MLGSTPQGYPVQGKGKVGNDHGDTACAIITTTKEAAQKAKGEKARVGTTTRLTQHAQQTQITIFVNLGLFSAF